MSDSHASTLHAPVALSSMTLADDHLVGHSDSHGAQPESAPAAQIEVNVRPLSSRELLGGLALIGSLLLVMFGTGALMATVVALLHKAFKAAMDDQVLAAAWGNAVGTVLMLVLVFVMVLATLLTMGERKWSAFIQNRVGPNRARLPIPGLQDRPLAGLPHIAADVLKMLTKEEVVPAEGNKLMFHLAPALAFAPAFVLFGVIPMSPTFTWMGEQITLQVAQIDQGVLYVFAVASIAVFGTSLAGWSSNNKYALLGGLRASAQMVSYEVTLGLTLVGLMMIFETVRLDVMSVEQGKDLFGILPAWGVFFQPLAIFAYFAAATAEMKRPPFDTPEGESEIVGYFIEYSGLKFGLFMIAELVEVVVFAGLFTTLFFGGYHLPFEGAIQSALQDMPGLFGLLQITSFIAKTVFFCWLSLVVRWTFPRFRYDQVMHLGWKMLLPLSLANVVLTGLALLWGGRDGAALMGLAQLVVVGAFVIGAFRIIRTGDETLLPSSTAPAGNGHGGHGDHGTHH